MKQDIKDRWVAALRSGEYTQGAGYLNANGKFCCLGVLCEIAYQDGIIEKKVITNITYYGKGTGTFTILPMIVTEWAGLPGPNPTVETTSLGALNDLGASFQKIADLIEERL